MKIPMTSYVFGKLNDLTYISDVTADSRGS